MCQGEAHPWALAVALLGKAMWLALVVPSIVLACTGRVNWMVTALSRWFGSQQEETRDVEEERERLAPSIPDAVSGMMEDAMETSAPTGLGAWARGIAVVAGLIWFCLVVDSFCQTGHDRTNNGNHDDSGESMKLALAAVYGAFSNSMAWVCIVARQLARGPPLNFNFESCAITTFGYFVISIYTGAAAAHELPEPWARAAGTAAGTGLVFKQLDRWDSIWK